MLVIKNHLVCLLLLVGLVAAAVVVFARVRSDYRKLGRLERGTAILQVGYFFVYAISSYAFLDSRFSSISISGPGLSSAIILMLIGFLMVIFSMPFLGGRSFGMNVGGLRTTGIYRFSRNPQLVGGFLFIIGYALLWPSWQGGLWASIWLLIIFLMVRVEEEHLKAIFGDEYRVYCKRTPRFLGFPRS